MSTEATMTKLGRITPILRIFDEAKAREFYVDFLGFKVDWEHRFEPDMPLYMQVSKDDCIIHLSEHFGDGSPGVHVRIEIRTSMSFSSRSSRSVTRTRGPALRIRPGALAR